MKKIILIWNLILVQSYSWAAIDSQACKRVSNGSYSVNNVDGAQNVSLINYNQAVSLFETLKKPKYKIPYLEAESSCEFRAHRVSEILYKENKISTVKTFLTLDRTTQGYNANGTPIYDNNSYFFTPRSEVTGQSNSWGYHVATAVCVRKDGRDELYVFDHAMFNQPVPYSYWERITTQGVPSDRWKSYSTTMFNLKELGSEPPYSREAFSPEDSRYVDKALKYDWRSHNKYRSGQKRTSTLSNPNSGIY